MACLASCQYWGGRTSLHLTGMLMIGIGALGIVLFVCGP